MRILYVEDKKALAKAVEQILNKNNYGVDISYDGEDGLYQALTGIYDIVVLDIMLPKMDGISVLQEMRKAGITTPVILLTAKGDPEDKVKGLDSGADDYLAKPFHAEELLARLRALGRRKGQLIHDGILRFGDLELNLSLLELTCRDNRYNLTLKESQLLEMLITNRGTIVNINSILEKLWGYDYEALGNHVRVHVSFLRKKMILMNSSVQIKAVRGVGYTLIDTKEVRDV